MSVNVTWPSDSQSFVPSKVYVSPRKLTFKQAPIEITETIPQDLPIPYFTLNNEKYILLKTLAGFWYYPSPHQLIGKLKKCFKNSKNVVKYTNGELNKALLEASLISTSDLKFKLSYIDANWMFNALENSTVLTETDAVGAKSFDEVRDFVMGTFQRRRAKLQSGQKGDGATEDSEFKITVNQVFPQYGGGVNGTAAVDFNHSVFNSLTNTSKFNYYSSNPSFSKFLPSTKMSMSELDMMIKENDHGEVDITTTAAALAEAEQNEVDDSLAPSTSASGEPTSSAGTGTGAGPSTGSKRGFQPSSSTSDAPKRRKPIGRSKKYNTNIDPNTIDLTESLIPGQGFIQEFNINHLCKVPNYYMTTNTMTANNLPGGTSLTTPGASQSSSSTPLQLTNGNTPTGAAVSTPPLKKSVSALFGGSSFYTDTSKLAKNVQSLLVNADQMSDNSISRYYYTMSYRGPGSGNYKDAALINKINKIPTTSTLHPQRSLKLPHKTAEHVANKKLNSSSKFNSSLKGFVHDSFTKELIDDTLTKQASFVADCSNLEILHNNLQFNVLLNAYREISEDTWDNYYKFKLIDFEQLGMNQREKAKLEAYNAAVEAAKRAQAEAAKKTEEEAAEIAKEVQEIREAHAAAVAEAEENDTSPPPSPELPEAPKPIQPKSVIIPPEPPKFRFSSRFDKPNSHPEVIKKFPLELRDLDRKENYTGTTYDEIPSIKDVLDIRLTSPDLVNPHLLTQIEVVKIPNANCLGWDNIKKYRD
ncbi:hypothetical protein CLIB1423_11S01376 [[Candida] railenensis]|uniref:Uncharacterized protein n=1 Tax=[Candida] railenensis TaxID=45579 RepID=A0A9P0QQ89_9ASCO|nr:hypothetical protein CLIB1423_11S01376 [[Candida] railenensis]